MSYKFPVAILLFISATTEGAPLCLPVYSEDEERETLAKFKTDGVQIVGIFTPDVGMRQELDLDKLRDAWASEQGIPLEDAWNGLTSVKEQCGQVEW